MPEDNPAPDNKRHEHTGDAELISQEHLLPGQDPLQPPFRRLSTIAPTSTIVTEDPRDVHVSLVRPESSSSNLLPDSIMAIVTAPTPQEHPSNPPHPSDYFSSAASPAHVTQGGELEQESHSDLRSSSSVTEKTGSSSDTIRQEDTKQAGIRDTMSAHHTQDGTHFTPQAEGPAERGRPRRSMSEYPKYPNQSLAALQTQIHPSRHPAPYSSRPSSQRQSSSGGIKTLATFKPRDPSNASQGSRTVGNTPIQTPHFHAPRALRHFPPPSVANDDETPFPSPYLHPSHIQPPRETNRANREFDLLSGRKSINQYEMILEIGRGTHGKVKLARNFQSGENVAIKIVQRYSKKRRLGKDKSNPEDKVKKEVAILKKAVHPNVVSLLEVIDDPEINKIYLVLEFCERHDVKWRTKGSSEVVLLEYRRLTREMNGEDENDDLPITEKFMEALAKRREPKIKKRPTNGLARVNSTTAFWSLEHGNISEGEEEENSNFSDPTSRRPLSVSISKPPKWEVQNAEISLSIDQVVRESESSLDDTSKTDTPAHVSDSQPPSQGDQSGANEGSNQKPTGDHKSYPRRASVAENFSHRLDELMEDEVPEEWQYVPVLTLSECRTAFRDAVLGLEYLHYQGIVHRDIKPENLLRKQDHSVKISDFGVSYLGKPVRHGNESDEASESEAQEYEEATELAKTVGTPAFFAPEMCSLDFTVDHPAITPQIDVWALGVTLFCLVYGRVPFVAENEFVLMRRIAEEEMFISTKRLKAVDNNAVISGPRGPVVPEKKDHRLPNELVYDDVDTELHDLLTKLLVKDPKERIKLKEVKLHPWTTRGLQSRAEWLIDSDPAKYAEGKKIEISKEEVQEAFIPLRLIERAKSVVKKVGGVFGMGGARATRKRGQSSAASSDAAVSSSGSTSAPPTSHPMSKSDKLTGAKADESISSALIASRDQVAEHPLSHSLHATSGSDRSNQSKQDSSRTSSSAGQSYDPSGRVPRPIMPGRLDSNLSTADSVRTLRQSDYNDFIKSSEVPEVPATPRETAASALGAIFGGAGKSLMRTMRSRDRGGESGSQSPVTSASPTPSNEHLYVEPSTALNSTSVSGHVHAPPLRSSPGPSTYSSPSSSKPSSSAALAQYGSSQVSSLAASPVMRGRGSDMPGHDIGFNDGDFDSRIYRSGQPASTGWGMDEASILKQQLAIQRSRTQNSQRSNPEGDSALEQMESGSASSSFLQLSPSGPSSPRPQSRQHPISSTSSEDPLQGAISQTTSFPSIPSVASANSSVVPERGSGERLKETRSSAKPSIVPANRQNVAIPAPSRPLVLTATEEQRDSGNYTIEEETQRAGGEAIETDEDDSDSGDEFLVMSRRKSRGNTSARKNSAHRVPKFRRDTTSSKKSTRSESANTVKKASSQEPSPNESDRDRHHIAS